MCGGGRGERGGEERRKERGERDQEEERAAGACWDREAAEGMPGRFPGCLPAPVGVEVSPCPRPVPPRRRPTVHWGQVPS